MCIPVTGPVDPAFILHLPVVDKLATLYDLLLKMAVIFYSFDK